MASQQAVPGWLATSIVDDGMALQAAMSIFRAVTEYGAALRWFLPGMQ